MRTIFLAGLLLLSACTGAENEENGSTPLKEDPLMTGEDVDAIVAEAQKQQAVRASASPRPDNSGSVSEANQTDQ